ncbi:hypothetical protein [Acidithrix sp. C25]|uniref:hypothetical protein n=1 Tax=Acidithrix sp. C25 TaxID=1671482 RepID=UPI00191BB11A|nr:hypothetical protein [Acidithrix sp. C25]
MDALESPFSTNWSESEPLRRDLLLMLKREGFTPPRVAKALALRQALGGEDEPFNVLRERLISAIESLHDPEPEMLLDAFALSPTSSNIDGLPERYIHYGQKANLKIDAVRKKVASAIENLRNQLTTGWYPKSPLPFHVPESHNGIVNEFVQVQTIVKGQKWQETREHYRFVAAFDKADYLGISSAQEGQIETVGDFSSERRRVDDHFEDRFYFKEPMRRGQAYDLKFRRLPEPDFDDPNVLVGEWRGFHEPTRLAIFEVAFLGRCPDRVWQFSGLTHLQAPGEPTKHQILSLSQNGSTRARFHDLYGGLFSGIAWEWNNDTL